ncbi:MAG: VaFE repeat-containing surface-anchored protein, partial [Lachnospiraceae bacterium]|nr:VaFE repeat-containing surface-anchored protein [Lachnospiraceae bacterium]
MRIRKYNRAISMLMAVTMAASGLMGCFPASAQETETELVTEAGTEAVTEAESGAADNTEENKTESTEAETNTETESTVKDASKEVEASKEAEASNDTDAEDETETETPSYTVTLPYYEGVVYTYEDGKLKEQTEDQSLTLAYEAGEKVEIRIEHAEEVLLEELHVFYEEDEEIGYEWEQEDGTLTFEMPEKDVWLDLALTSVETATESGTESEQAAESETTEEEAWGWIEYVTTEGGSINASFEYYGEIFDAGTYTYDMMEYGPWEAQYEITGNVLVTASANDGYELEAITVTDGDGNLLASYDTETVSITPSADYKMIITAFFTAKMEEESESEEAAETETEEVITESETEAETEADMEAETEVETEAESGEEYTALPDEVTQNINKGYGGIVPTYAGVTVEGREYTITAGDEDFDIYSLPMDYSTEYFKYYLVDDGGYNCNAVGDYAVMYAVSHCNYPDYAWYVTNTVHVVDAYSESGATVIVDSYTMKAAAPDGTAEYGIWYTTESGEFTMDVTDSYDITLSITATMDGEEADPFDFITVTDGNGPTEKVVAFAITDAADHAYVITLSNDDESEGKALESGGGWYDIDEDLLAALDAAEDGSEEQMEILGAIDAAINGTDTDEDSMSSANDGIFVASEDDIATISSSTTASASAGSFTATMLTGYQTGHNSDGSAETNYGTVLLAGSSSYTATINKLLSTVSGTLGIEASISSSQLTNIYAYCISGHNYYGWPVSTYVTVTVYVKATTTATTSDDGSTTTYTTTITLYTYAYYGSGYQTFYGKKTITDTETEHNTGFLTIRKCFDGTGLISAIGSVENSLLGDLGTTFAIYEVTGYDDEGNAVFDEDNPVETIKMNADNSSTGTIETDDGEEVVYQLKYDVELDPGTYVVRETYRIKGTVDNTATVYGPYTVEAGSTATVQTEWIKNYIFRYYGYICTKTNSNGTPLEGAVFKVQYYSTQSNSKQDTDGYAPIATWYFKSDSSGYVKYTADYYLESWTDSDGTTYYSDALWTISTANTTTGYCLPIGSLKITEVEAPEGYELPDDPVQKESIQAVADDDGYYTIRYPVLFTNNTESKEQLAKGREFVDVQYQQFEFLKVASEDTSVTLAGAEYRVYFYKDVTNVSDISNFADYTKRYRLFSDENGLVVSDDDHKKNTATFYEGENTSGLPYGVCLVVEIVAPEGRELNNPVTKSFDDGDVNMAMVIKITESGVKYYYYDGVSTASGTEGIVYLEDDLSTGYLTMMKSSANTSVTNGNTGYSLKGAQYTVYTDSSCSTIATDTSGNNAVLTVADDDGTTNTLAMIAGTYYVKETNTPEGYLADTAIHPVELTSSNTASNPYKLEVSEIPITYRADLILKKTNEANTDMSLEGAVFEARFYAGSSSAGGSATKTWYLTSDEEGKVHFDPDCLDSDYTSSSFYKDSNGDYCLPIGCLVISEAEAPTGYVKTSDTVTYTLTGSGWTITNGTETVSGTASTTGTTTIENDKAQEVGYINNVPAFGSVSIDKLDAETSNGSAQGDGSLEGFTFDIISQNDYTVTVNDGENKNYSKGEVVLTIITNENGHAESGNVLQVGDYTVVESGQGDGYSGTGTNTSYEIEISKNEETISYEVTNYVLKGGMSVQKIDLMLGENADHGDTDLSGAEFTIVNGSSFAVLNADGDEITAFGLSGTDVTYADVEAAIESGCVMQTITTDADGYASTGTSDLPYGTYYVIETKAATGYLLNETWVGRIEVREDGVVYTAQTIQDSDSDEDSVAQQIYLGGLSVQKFDYMLDESADHGDTDLSCAEFTIINASDTVAVNKDGDEIQTSGLSGTGVTYADVEAAIESGSAMQTIKTDSNGFASTGTSDLPYGTYYVIETKAATGYIRNETWVGMIKVREDGVVYAAQTIQDSDSRDESIAQQIYRGGISLVKNDAELEAAGTQGYTSLEDAEFAIINTSDAAAMNKDGQVIPSAKSLLSEDPTYAELRALADDGSYTMQVIATDADGYAETGENDLPYGTYYVIEIKSSYGYWIDESFVGMAVIRDDSVLVALGGTSGDSLFTDINDAADGTVDQTPRRSDLNFLKVNIDGEYKAYIPFLISAIYVDEEGNETVLESHVIVSDKNGLVDTSRTHSTNTNGFDEYVVDGVVTAEGEALLEEASAWGIWFGTMDAINDSYGALYPAYYKVTEIQCEDNSSLSENLLESYLIYIYNDTGDLTALLSDSDTNNAQENTYHPLVDTEIVLTSSALDVESDTQTVPVRESVEVSDTVTFTHVSADHTYRMETQFVDITDGNTVLPIAGTNDEGASVSDDGKWVTKEFQPKKQSGTNNTYGDITLSALLNTEGLNGHTIVAVDYLYQYVNGYWILVAKHEDLTDTDQMLYVPDIHTTAADSLTGTRVGAKSTEDAILDTVSYSNLAKGEIYVIVMQVLDADTGEAMEDGKTVQSGRIYSRSDTPISGTIEMPEFTLDSSSFEDRTLVVVESLYRADADGNPVGEAILVHDSIVDEDQTIRYPDVHTSACDSETGDDVGTSSGTTTVYDEVTVTNVIFDDNDLNGPYSYTVKGTLVYQQDFTDADGVSHKAGEAVKTFDGTQDEVTITSDAAGNAVFSYADGSVAKGSITITGYGQNAAKTAGGDAADNSYVTDTTAAIATITVELVYKVDSSKLEGGTVVVFEDLYHKDVNVASHADLTDDKQSVHYPEVETSAADYLTGDDVGAVKKAATITDTVILSNLIPGRTYTVSGTLVNQADGSTLIVNGKVVTQTAEITVGNDGTISTANGETAAVTAYDAEHNTVNGTVELTFTFDATGMEGETVVVFENLIHNGVVVAAHNDLSDENQSVHFPEIHTNAADGYTQDHVGTVTGSSEETADGVSVTPAVIVDTVTYENLVPGREYTISGTLVNKDTGYELVDGQNQSVIAERTFIAGETEDGITATVDEETHSVSGTVELTFTFDASLLAGVTVVAFENLEHKGITVVTHSDLNDEDQTIHFPDVQTSAADGTVGDEVGLTGETAIMDTVSLSNLLPGHEYTIKGVLMDKDTGAELLVDGETVTQEVKITVNADGTVTAENGGTVAGVFYDVAMNSVDCTVELVYTLDASTLAGVTTVVFEDLIHNDVIVASHADITDLGQSVHFPEIHTTAADLDTSDHVGTVTEEAVIEDEVFYTNLVVGKEYTLTGMLYNRETGLPFLDEEGNLITAAATFTAVAESTDENNTVTAYHKDNNSVDGAYLITFTLDSSLLAGKTVIAFESLSHNDVEVTVHADLSDNDQSVYYPDIHTTAVDSRTGDHVGSIWGALINTVRKALGQDIEDDAKQVITDTVALENLVPGMTYVVSGKLYNGTESLESGVDTPLVVDGEEITQAVTITVSEDGKSITAADGSKTSVTAYNEGMNSVDGTVDLVYTLDSSKIQGIEMVVFEKLYQDAAYTAETNPDEVPEEDLVNEHSDITDEGQSVSEISIYTTAVDTTTGDHVGAVPDGTSITSIHDEVNLAGLVAGMEYTIDGVLVSLGDSDLSLGKICYLKADGTLTDDREEAYTETYVFTAEETSETYSLNFAITADKVQGLSLTVFENIYHNDELISSHPAGDGNGWDEEALAEQTVYYPTGKTNAADTSTDEHMSLADTNRTIVDRVYFENLLMGQEYNITGQLVYKEVFTDSDGVSHAAGEVLTDTVTVCFTAATELTEAVYTDGSGNTAAVDSVTAATLADGQTVISGYVSISFTVDASKLAGATLVAFESFSHNDADIFTHRDLDDLPQTIKIPEIGTTANVDGIDEAAIYNADGSYVDIIITDTVTYKNLWTADELEVMADAAKYIEYNDGTYRTQDGAIYSVSEDAVYILKGVLMDKETGEALIDSNGNTYTVYSDPFTPESSNGTYDVAFTINAGDFLDENGETTLAGKSLVVFEELYLASFQEEATEENKVAEHEDIEDTDQDIRIPNGRTHAVPDNGTNSLSVQNLSMDTMAALHSTEADRAHQVQSAESVTIVDYLAYENLHGNTVYTVTG